MTVEHQQLPLWSQLQLVRLTPETVDLIAIFNQVDLAISQLPESQKMQVAAEAMLQLAQLCLLRSEVLIQNWESAYRDPQVKSSFFSDVVRQTMAVDLSDLIQLAAPRKRHSKSILNAETSVAVVVDKSAILAMVEQLEAESQVSEPSLSNEQKKQLALASAHDEDISAWKKAIAQWMQQSDHKAVSLLQLQQLLGMPLIEIWLGLLLGGIEQYQWERSGEFYHDARDILLFAL